MICDKHVPNTLTIAYNSTINILTLAKYICITPSMTTNRVTGCSFSIWHLSSVSILHVTKHDLDQF